MNRNSVGTTRSVSTSRRPRPSSVVAAEIARILEKHGVPPLATSALAIGDEIGKGRFKQVRQGTLRVGKAAGEQRDVVILRYAKRDGEIKELEILATLAQRIEGRDFVPEVLGACGHRDATLIVQERATFGALKSALAPNSTPEMTPTHKVVAASQLSRAMGFLQQVKVVHADLACRNVLLFQLEEDPAQTMVKVTDFGLAVLLPAGSSHVILKQPQATRWCAPETVATCKLSHRSDLWSLGATIWELYANGQAPWVNREKRAAVAARLRDLAETGGEAEGGVDVSDDFPPPDGMTPEVREVMLSCMQADEEVRPGFADIGQALEEILNPTEEPTDGPTTGEQPAQPSARAVGGASDWETSDVGVSANVVPDGVETPSTAASALSQHEAINWTEVSNGADVLGIVCSNSKAGDSSFRRLRAFLWSPHAAKLLGHEVVKAMQLEVEEAEARQAYHDEFARRRREAAELEDEAQLQQACQEELARRRRRIEQGHQFIDTWTPSSSAVRDELVSLAPAGAPLEYEQRGWQPHLMWTLWVLERSDCLRRTEFATEDDAMLAFAAMGVPGPPRVLRNPAGETIAFRSWATAQPHSSSPLGGSLVVASATAAASAAASAVAAPSTAAPMPAPSMSTPLPLRTRPGAMLELDVSPVTAVARQMRQQAHCTSGVRPASATPPVPMSTPSQFIMQRIASPAVCQRPHAVAVSPMRSRRLSIPMGRSRRLSVSVGGVGRPRSQPPCFTQPPQFLPVS